VKKRASGGGRKDLQVLAYPGDHQSGSGHHPAGDRTIETVLPMRHAGGRVEGSQFGAARPQAAAADVEVGSVVRRRAY